MLCSHIFIALASILSLIPLYEMVYIGRVINGFFTGYLFLVIPQYCTLSTLIPLSVWNSSDWSAFYFSHFPSNHDHSRQSHRLSHLTSSPLPKACATFGGGLPLVECSVCLACRLLMLYSPHFHLHLSSWLSSLLLHNSGLESGKSASHLSSKNLSLICSMRDNSTER